MNAVNTFVDAMLNTPVLARTENGMRAQESTMRAVVDLFYNIGSSRGKNVTKEFERAYQDDADLALRIALWTRDVRGGAGERQLFRDILQYLEKFHREVLLDTKFLAKVPELGRWDDLLVLNYDPEIRAKVVDLIRLALLSGNGLCAKWMDRKDWRLRKELGMSPKAYRKLLVNLSNTVEQAMCAKDYERINYAHVPSLAMSRYMKAFSKNDAERFVAFRESLKKGETKVNAAALYPYDIMKALNAGADSAVCDAQWAALPDYMDGTNVLPLVDVSGSMMCAAGGNPNVQCIDVSVSLGLYCASKNKGAFKDVFATFSEYTELQQVKGSISEKLRQIKTSKWGMNTNLHAAFEKILTLAVKGKVAAEDMPSVLLILSDMQFDECAKLDHSAMQMIEHKYTQAGYKVPVIVFWNLRPTGNAPVSFNKKGVALVSGFSPAIMKAVLAADFDDLSPLSIVRDAVSSPRYDYKL
jgi:hypothetical protein